jgi:hypothetical protein
MKEVMTIFMCECPGAERELKCFRNILPNYSVKYGRVARDRSMNAESLEILRRKCWLVGGKNSRFFQNLRPLAMSFIEQVQDHLALAATSRPTAWLRCFLRISFQRATVGDGCV